MNPLVTNLDRTAVAAAMACLGQTPSKFVKFQEHLNSFDSFNNGFASLSAHYTKYAPVLSTLTVSAPKGYVLTPLSWPQELEAPPTSTEEKEEGEWQYDYCSQISVGDKWERLESVMKTWEFDTGEPPTLMQEEEPPDYAPYRSELHNVELGTDCMLLGGMPRKNPPRRPKGKQRVYNPQAVRKGPGRHTSSRLPGVVFPAEMRVRLPYTANGIITNAGATNIGQRWHTNAAYDVDPIFGSTATVGFYELSQMFHFYRVRGIKVWLEVVNNESFPVILYTIHSNNDLGTTGALAAAQSGNPLCQTTMLAPLGYGGATKIVSAHTIAAVVGSSAPLTEDNYRGLINGLPADLTWFGIYATAGPVNVFTVNKGISYAIRLSMDIQFYGRTVLTQ